MLCSLLRGEGELMDDEAEVIEGEGRLEDG